MGEMIRHQGEGIAVVNLIGLMILLMEEKSVFGDDYKNQ